MIKKIAYLLLAAVLGMTGCKGGGAPATGSRQPQPGDTVYTEQAAMAVHATQPDLALAIIDSALMVGNITELRASFLRAKVFSQSYNMHREDTVILICENLLRQDAVRSSPAYRQDVLSLLVSASRMRQDISRWLRFAVQLADLFRSEDDETSALRTDAEIGSIMTYLGQYEEGMAKLDGAIRRLDGVRRFNELDASIIAMKRKIVVLEEQADHASIIPIAHHIIERLDDYAAHPGDYHDDSMREPDDSVGRADYCQFYRAQALAFLSYAYAAMASQDGADSEACRAKAFEALEQYRQTAYGQTFSGRRLISQTLRELKRYDEMLAIYDEMEQRSLADGDTLNADFATMLYDRAVAARAQGHPLMAADYWKRYADISQQLHNDVMRSEANHYAARYHAQEQQLEIQTQQAAATRNGLIALTLAVGLIFAVVFAVWFSRQKRIVSQKNHVLSEQIADAIAYKEKYHRLNERLRTAADANPPSDADLSSLSDADLFQYIRSVVLAEHLFLDPTFGRQSLQDRLGLSKERIGQAFAQGSDYSSLPDFVNDCRLEYAFNQISARPDLSITDIAHASGFTNATTFGRRFKEKFALTPTEHRAMG